MANSGQKEEGSASVPGTRRKAVPIVLASGPHEYTPGDQEFPVRHTSLADMLQWVQTRSGEAEEPNSWLSRRTTARRFAATCVTRTAISSRSAKLPLPQPGQAPCNQDLVANVATKSRSNTILTKFGSSIGDQIQPNKKQAKVRKPLGVVRGQSKGQGCSRCFTSSLVGKRPRSVETTPCAKREEWS